jgi:hypothetical protein
MVSQPGPNDDDSGPRPWEEPGVVRRDCEPHRGPALRLLARAGLAVGGLAAALAGLTPLGLAYAPHDPACFAVAAAAAALAAAAWALAGGVWWGCRRDLALMRAGRMDPSGRARTAGARLVAAAVLALPPVGLAAGLLAAWAAA